MLMLVAAASIVTAVDAERAFIRDSKAHGQWTAFRKWASDDAVMFAKSNDSTTYFVLRITYDRWSGV